MATLSSRRRRARRLFSALVLLGVMASIVWGIGFSRFSDAIPQSPENASVRTDAIVVLTGGSGRLEAGLDLLSADLADRLFISGVYQGIDVATLLQMFRDNPEELETRVEIGNATNTRGNAAETAVWVKSVGVSSIRLVTAAYHMPRSVFEFQHAMPGITLYPHPVFPEHVKSDWWHWPGSAELVFKEYNKVLLAWVRVTVSSLFGKPIAK